MSSNSICFPEDIWGELKCITIPEPEIYYIFGHQADGYAVPQNYTGAVISKKALACGITRGEMLYFPSGETMNIIEYELTRHNLQYAQHNAEKALLQERMASIEQYGRVDCSNYFGAYPPPNETPLGIVEDFIHIVNGIYFTKSEGEWLLSICEPIADCELTIVAVAFGRRKKDYCFYDTVTCAIPICELRHTYSAIAALVSSEEALFRTLCNHFLTYILVYNEGEALEMNKLPEKFADNSNEDFLILPQRK